MDETGRAHVQRCSVSMHRDATRARFHFAASIESCETRILEHRLGSFAALWATLDPVLFRRNSRRRWVRKARLSTSRPGAQCSMITTAMTMSAQCIDQRCSASAFRNTSCQVCASGLGAWGESSPLKGTILIETDVLLVLHQEHGCSSSEPTHQRRRGRRRAASSQARHPPRSAEGGFWRTTLIDQDRLWRASLWGDGNCWRE